MVFHWTMLVVVLRHFRFFIEPVADRGSCWLQNLDGFFQIGVPVIYAIDGAVRRRTAVSCSARRLFDAKVRYFSLPADYFALFLLLGIGISGVLDAPHREGRHHAGQGGHGRLDLVPARRTDGRRHVVLTCTSSW